MTSDPKQKVEILQSQYISVFSDPDKANWDQCKGYMGPEIKAKLNDIHFEVDCIKAATSELYPYSATPDGEIPAKILCSCKESLAVPPSLLWNSSFTTGKIPKVLKLQFITSLYKKETKLRR